MHSSVRLVTAFVLLGCHRAAPVASGPMPQHGYLWQRNWSPAVADAFQEAERRLDGIVVLGGEIVWEKAGPRFVRASVEWEVLARASKRTAVALRVAPFGGAFRREDANARFVVATAKSLLQEAGDHGGAPNEFQLDFDCPQKKLAGYRQWVEEVRAAIEPVPLVITTLPAWLDEPEFAPLLHSADAFVLQVHSVPVRGAGTRATLCDPSRARAWTERAAKFGRPFSVALPTYRCLAGYDERGRLLGVAMDAVQPSWPAGTRVLEFAADAEALAQLIADWNRSRPANLRSILWYRIPTERDVRNWGWPTLAAVMAGRAPAHRLEVSTAGENPVDVLLTNLGEAEEQLHDAVIVRLTGASLEASDALPGWTLSTPEGTARFMPEPGALRLAPGEQRVIGWLRYDRLPQLSSALVR